MLEALDVLNEESDPQRRGSGRVRARLPGRNLRLVRIHDQRGRARPARQNNRLPAFAASFQGRRELHRAWRARAFPVLRDLMVDRSAFDRIISAGGYISVPAGSAPDGNTIPVDKDDSDRAMDAAACIGCGACVAACPNASASLFTGAKISHLGLLPQGQPERDSRALRMVAQMNRKGSVNAPISANAKRSAPRVSHWKQ